MVEQHTTTTLVGRRPPTHLHDTRPPCARIRRPRTVLAVVLQKWRGLFCDPLCEVEVTWSRALAGLAEYRICFDAFDPEQPVRIAIDVALSDERAAHALGCALAELHMLEVSEQCAAVLDQIEAARPCVAAGGPGA